MHFRRFLGLLQIYKWSKTREQKYRVDTFSRGLVASLCPTMKSYFCSVSYEHFRWDLEVSQCRLLPLVSYQSAFLLCHCPPSSSSVIFLFFSPLWLSHLPISTLRIRRAKLLCSRTFRKGWTLTFCKMSELLLDPSFAGSAIWLDSDCVLSSWRAHAQTGGHWSTNRCHGSKEGVDWSLERPHSSANTPEKTPGSHTLFILEPFCLSLLSHPYDFAKLALLYRIRYPPSLCCLLYVSSEANRGSLLTSLLWYGNGNTVSEL